MPDYTGQAEMPQHFGGVIDLLDYAINPTEPFPGDMTTIYLDWQATGIMQKKYAVYLHLLDESGALITQTDGTPIHQGRPLATWFWPVLVTIFDQRTLTIPEDLPVGTYMLRVGWYGRVDSQRLPIIPGNGVPDGLDLAIITVE